MIPYIKKQPYPYSFFHLFYNLTQQNKQGRSNTHKLTYQNIKNLEFPRDHLHVSHELESQGLKSLHRHL